MFKIFLESLVDLIIPTSEAEKRLRNLTDDELSETLPRLWPDKDVLSTFVYRKSLCSKLVWAIKFRRHKRFIKFAGRILADSLLEEISERFCFARPKPIVIIPMPSSKTRRRERGFNQCELLAKEIARHLPVKIETEFLFKKDETKHQSRLPNRAARLRNLQNSFWVEAKKYSAEAFYVLLDDVMTTGATLAEAESTLKKAGVKEVLKLTLAH